MINNLLNAISVNKLEGKLFYPPSLIILNFEGLFITSLKLIIVYISSAEVKSFVLSYIATLATMFNYLFVGMIASLLLINSLSVIISSSVIISAFNFNSRMSDNAIELF